MDFSFQVDAAKTIILKSLKQHKPIVEFKLWEQLDVLAKAVAYSQFDFTPIPVSYCPLCHKYTKLPGTFTHAFGTDFCCANCDQLPTPAEIEIRRMFPVREAVI